MPDGGRGDNVKENECEGAEFLITDITRAKSDGWAVGACALECGVRTNWVICSAGKGT